MSDWLPVHIELVRRLATPSGLIALTRAQMAGAVLKPMARYSVNGDMFLAEVLFEQPLGPERQLGVMMALAPKAQNPETTPRGAER